MSNIARMWAGDVRLLGFEPGQHSFSVGPKEIGLCRPHSDDDIRAMAVLIWTVDTGNNGLVRGVCRMRKRRGNLRFTACLDCWWRRPSPDRLVSGRGTRFRRLALDGSIFLFLRRSTVAPHCALWFVDVEPYFKTVQRVQRHFLPVAILKAEFIADLCGIDLIRFPPGSITSSNVQPDMPP
jgi:hypothetical protein